MMTLYLKSSGSEVRHIAIAETMDLHDHTYRTQCGFPHLPGPRGDRFRPVVLTNVCDPEQICPACRAAFSTSSR
jgi:hypothetical protein